MLYLTLRGFTPYLVRESEGGGAVDLARLREWINPEGKV
jgi:hypothetical protein